MLMNNNKGVAAKSLGVFRDKHADCIHCSIRNQMLFSEVPQELLGHLQNNIDDQKYPRHSELYQQDEKGDFLFTIRRGLVKLVRELPNGTKRIVRLLRRGDVAGLEITLGHPYQHTAIALQEADVCRIPMSVISYLSKDHPHLCHPLMERWQRGLDEADRFIVELSTGVAEMRFARLLIFLGESVTDRNCMSISREDMGAMLGITIETASRIMTDFKRRGLVKEISGTHCQCDFEQLRRIAQG